MSYQYSKLENGIRLVHRKVKGSVSHCALMVNTGSRDEKPHENGMAHFIEHMIFKGTRKRKAYHVLSRIENIGGDLNAFTTKEETCIYASFLSPYYEHSLELFADVAFNSVFPQKEIAKEKDVIIDEINSYQDSPAELIFDDFEDLLFRDHPLGRNILGTIETVGGIRRNDIFRFIKNNYSTDQMVIGSVGDIPFKKLETLARKHFGSIRPSGASHGRKPFSLYLPKNHSTQKDSYLTHAITGNLAYPRNHPKRLTLAVVTNLLGGPALNSRLNLAIREKYGYAYSIEAVYQPYSDTGMFGVYLGTDRNNIEKSLRLVHKELKKLSDQKLGTMQLHRAKRQVMGQLAISLESRLSEMLGIAKNHLHDGYVKTVEEIMEEIHQISAGDVLEVAEEIFNPDQMSNLVYQSKEEA
ncbi:MAG: pitrilysin family protein [bacterium]